MQINLLVILTLQLPGGFGCADLEWLSDGSLCRTGDICTASHRCESECAEKKNKNFRLANATTTVL